MVYLGYGNTLVRAWSLSDRVPYRLDNQISPLYPESWGAGIYKLLFPKIMKKRPGCEIIEQNIQKEHLQILMVIPSKYVVSDVIGEIKQYTASKIGKKFARFEKVYWKENFVSTVGLEEKQITEYVNWQGDQDSGQAKPDL
ncbi:MAG: transposase [bacterium]|nr:transposase [bacterium]